MARVLLDIALMLGAAVCLFLAFAMLAGVLMFVAWLMRGPGW